MLLSTFLYLLCFDFSFEPIRMHICLMSKAQFCCVIFQAAPRFLFWLWWMRIKKPWWLSQRFKSELSPIWLTNSHPNWPYFQNTNELFDVVIKRVKRKDVGLQKKFVFSQKMNRKLFALLHGRGILIMF